MHIFVNRLHHLWKLAIGFVYIRIHIPDDVLLTKNPTDLGVLPTATVGLGGHDKLAVTLPTSTAQAPLLAVSHAEPTELHLSSRRMLGITNSLCANLSSLLLLTRVPWLSTMPHRFSITHTIRAQGCPQRCPRKMESWVTRALGHVH